MVLAGGGDGALAEVREAVARSWPLFVIEGTGGLADAIATVMSGSSPRRASCGRARRRRRAPRRIRGRRSAPRSGDDLRDESGPRDESALKDAWGMFATYDHLAVQLRDAFERFQLWILVLGVLATAIALDLRRDRRRRRPGRCAGSSSRRRSRSPSLIALANRRAAGKRWILLRAAAEAVKSEIYRYRTRTGVYSRARRSAAAPSRSTVRGAWRGG